MSNIVNALISLRPTSSWEMQNPEDYSTIKWFDNTVPPTKEEVDAEVIRLQSVEVAAQQAAETHKANAISKLTALGLSTDEINALIG